MNRNYLRAMMRRFLQASDRIIAVSEATRRDTIERYGVAPDRIVTIHPGVSEGFAPPSADAILRARARYQLPERYLLCVATIEPRKNHALLFRALARLRPTSLQLVLAGRRGWKHEPILAGMRAAGVAGRVLELGPVPDTDLPALMAGADLFVFPSLFEGYGAPVAEAMACGAPVVTSDRASLPEVVGDAGILLPADDVTAWVETLQGLLDDPAARARLRESGLARARQFGLDVMARRTLEVYRQAHAHRS